MASNGPTASRPIVVRRDVLWETVGDEIVVLDKTRQRAYRLNPAASVVWRHCDGKRGVAELARILEQELKTPEPAAALVEAAAQRFTELGLMASAPLTRRHLAVGAGVAAGMVASMVLPKPARALSLPDIGTH